MSLPSERIWKLISLGLGAILFIQVVRIVARSRPLAHVKIPDVPVWVDTNAPAPAKATNSIASSSTNKTSSPGSAKSTSGTNAASKVETAKQAQPSTKNSTNETVTTSVKTNTEPGVAISKTNLVATADAATNRVASNTVSVAEARAKTSAPGQTNSLAKADSPRGTNSTARAEPPRMAMNPFGMPGAGRKGPGPDMPPEIKARVDRIVDSEIFAPVMRPLPMALLGIAGNVVFLRAPNGQTGMVKEQEEVGGIKLLRIGTNRVLVLEDGQEKELTIFAGMGGESLLPKQKDNPR